jgi:hypothetical protein
MSLGPQLRWVRAVGLIRYSPSRFLRSAAWRFLLCINRSAKVQKQDAAANVLSALNVFGALGLYKNIIFD